MDFDELLIQVGNEPLFESSLLLSGDSDTDGIRQQLTRWTASGKLHQFRRGLYALAPPYAKTEAHPFLVANRLVLPSYVSLQSALRYHTLIPEHVPTTTSVTTSRPNQYDTDIGSFMYRRISHQYFWGYDTIEFEERDAFVAKPEKALLDLVYLEPGGDQPAFLESLRLQNLDVLDMQVLTDFTERWQKPKIKRAVDAISAIVQADTGWIQL